LIRNTPYGKRIQNKLQREQLDNFSGFSNQQALVNMALGNQAMGTPHGGNRHLPQGLADVYTASNGLYPMQSQGNYGQSHLGSQMHSLQPQSIDGYVLQGNSSHNQGAQSQPHSHANSFNAGSFTNLPPFVGSINDPYQRTVFGYGM
jgi:hypothetical protein